MEEHNPTLIAKEKNCSVSRCTCGTYHLNYHYTTIHLKLEGLIRVMEIAYNYIDKGGWYKKKKPLNITFATSALFITPEDFNSFYKVLEDSTTIEMNINQLVYNDNNEFGKQE